MEKKERTTGSVVRAREVHQAEDGVAGGVLDHEAETRTVRQLPPMLFDFCFGTSLLADKPSWWAQAAI